MVANFNNLDRPKFRVAVRAVHDRFFKLIENLIKTKKRKQELLGLKERSLMKFIWVLLTSTKEWRKQKIA